MDYEWDEKKYSENKLKHGIRFEEAVAVFSDHNALEFSEIVDNEERFIRMGLNVHRGILVVVYCERGIQTIRIISARKATKTEKTQYEERI